MNPAIRDTLQLLRLPFSLLLLPIFLLALSQAPAVEARHALAAALILHLLVYPASNGYNSWIDRDTTPIGGLEAPPMPPKLLLWVTLAMDSLALLWAYFLHPAFAVATGVYILASRAYSWPGIRLKKYPIGGFLTVFVVQGFWTYLTAMLGVVPPGYWPDLLMPQQLGLALGAACLIGGVYPLTQIYQHGADAMRGDRSLSLILGYRGTFVFSGALFALGGLLFMGNLPRLQFLLFVLCLAPVLVYFMGWARQVWADIGAANFEYTMRMNFLAAICLNLCFGLFCLGRLG